MNTIVKLSVASAIAMGYATAQAGVPIPSTGASDLVLFVQDTVSGVTYGRDTGISIDSVLKTSALQASASPNTNFNPTPAVISDASINFSLAADANLNTFLTAAGSDQLQWAVEAVQFPTASNTTNDRVTGKSKFLTTTSTGSSQVVNTTATKMGGMGSGLANDIATLNSHITSGNSTFGVAGPTSGVWNTTDGPGSANWYTFSPLTTGLLIGVANPSELYGMTGNGGTGQAQVYDLGAITLSAGGLLNFVSASGGGSAVPLPAALWLFGSGLLGLAGVGRRRSASVPA